MLRSFSVIFLITIEQIEEPSLLSAIRDSANCASVQNDPSIDIDFIFSPTWEELDGSFPGYWPLPYTPPSREAGDLLDSSTAMAFSSSGMSYEDGDPLNSSTTYGFSLSPMLKDVSYFFDPSTAMVISSTSCNYCKLTPSDLITMIFNDYGFHRPHVRLWILWRLKFRQGHEYDG